MSNLVDNETALNAELIPLNNLLLFIRTTVCLTLFKKIIQNRKATLDNPINLPEIYVKHVTERILSFSTRFTDTQ